MFTTREIATMLAALKLFQFDIGYDKETVSSLDYFMFDEPLSVAEIDDLCERLNN